MNTKKFFDLLDQESLFFPNAMKLSDQYEVSIPDEIIREKRRSLSKEGFSGRDLDEELARYYYETNPEKELVLVNCWSVQRYESYALWKIYLGGERNGVAVKTSVSQLKKSILNGKDEYSEDFYIGKIKYNNILKKENINRLSVVTTKKPFYDFERELRIFILHYSMSEGGVRPPYDVSAGRSVKVDLSSLLQKVYISPFSDESYKEDIERKLVSINGSNKSVQVVRSEIRDK